MDYIKLHPLYRELQVDDHVRLIEPDITHSEPSLLWVSSPEVIQYMGADFDSPSLVGEKKRIEDILKNEDEYSWMIELDGKIVGNVCINAIAEKTKKFGKKAGNLTVLIGEKSEWGKGLGAKVCSAVLHWAFEECGFEVIAARSLQENLASIKTLEKLGFEEIGSEPYDGLIAGKPSTWRNFKIQRNEQVHIEPYDRKWPKKFALEKKLIEKVIAQWIDGGVHHVGSTAIPDLPAKPIVDIQVGVKNLEESKACIPLLEAIGYCYYPYRPYMHWFCKPSPSHREFHVQLIEPTHPQWSARLAFRDYLRAHSETAKEYAVLKQELAEKFRDDREAYTEAKAKFVESVVKKAQKTEKIKVRAAKEKDAPRIAEIHVETWQHAYRGQVPDAFLDNLPSTLGDRTKKWQETLRKRQRGMRVFVAERGKQIVGFCIVNPCRDEDMDNKTVGELGAIYIDARYMNQGVGSALLKESLSFLEMEGFKKATLWVLDTNEKARKWYESKGWKVEGKTKVDDRGDVKLHEVRYEIML